MKITQVVEYKACITCVYRKPYPAGMRDEAKKEMDDLTKKYVEQIDELLKTKSDEIMEV